MSALRWILLILTAAVCGVVPTTRATQKSKGRDYGVQLVVHKSIISPQKELAIGKQYTVQMEKTEEFVTDPLIEGYVQAVAQNVTRQINQSFPLTLRVTLDARIHSVVLPGGFLYVSAGLIKATHSEGELASVLAHDVAHVAARHWAALASMEVFSRAAMAVPSGSITTVPPLHEFYFSLDDPRTRQVGGAEVPGTFLTFRRGYELEADRFALLFMYEARYDPASLISFLKSLPEECSSEHEVFLDQPRKSVRIREAEEVIKRFPPRGQYLANAGAFEAVKGRVDELLASQKKEREDSAKDPARPSLVGHPPAKTP